MFIKMQDTLVSKFYFFIFTFLTQCTLFSQIQYKEANFGRQFYSGIVTATADINHDFIDDFIVLDQSKQLWIGENSAQGNIIWRQLDFRSGEGIWSIVVGDVDHDFKNDIILAGDPSGCHILYNKGNDFVSAIIEDSRFFPQAATLYDLNNDGKLDYTVCDDNSESRVYFSNAAGVLNRDTNFIDLSLSQQELEAGNYGCTWTDIDVDGDADFYISRCRAGVDDITDLRRKNFLYIQENNQFYEKGDEYGIGIFDQSWCSAFRDLDGDLLPDLVVVNHYTPIRVFRQNSNHTFQDQTAFAGIQFAGIPIQMSIEDYDNDGDQDIFISGTTSELWLNNGKMNFSKSAVNVSDVPFSSFSVGDFNTDGVLDFYCSYADLLNNPNNKKDRLFYGQGNSNQFINISLQGTASNTNGIGAKIFVTSNGKTQYREFVIGESFGVQNSLNLHFGLGKNNIVEELKIIWPSKLVSIYRNIAAGKFYIIGEYGCISEKIQINPSQDQILCANEIKILTAEDVSFIEWNNGVKERVNSVSSEGIYFYTSTDDKGCNVISKSVAVIYNPDRFPKLNFSNEYNLCTDEFIELKVEGYPSVQWQDGSISSSLFVNKTGLYFGKVKGECRDFYSDSLIVRHNDFVDEPIIPRVEIVKGSSAILQSNQLRTNWYETETDPTAIYTGNRFVTPVLNSPRVYWASAFDELQYNFVRGGMLQASYRETPFQANFLNPSMYFQVYIDFVLDSITVFTDRAGLRKFELVNGNKEVVASKEVLLQTGKNIIALGFNCEAKAGTYSLTTNEAVNIAQFQSKSPWLYRSDQGFVYPFFIQNLAKIISSSLGDTYYYFFYDWVIHRETKECESRRVAVNVDILSSIHQSEQLTDHIYYKNKSIILSQNANIDGITIFDLYGREIYSSEKINQTIDVSNLIPGIYFAKITNRNSKNNQFSFVVD